MDGMVIPAPPEGARDGVGASRARRLDLAITGMTGATCAARVERALGRGEGVLSASVSFATGRARVLLGSDQREDDASLAARLQSAVAEAGYGASLLQEDGAGRDAAVAEAEGRERLHLVLACLLSGPLVASMLLHPLAILLHHDRLAQQVMLPGWLQLVLATPVQFWLGSRFYRGAFAALRERSGNMDLLIAVGSSAAWGLSTVSLLLGAPRLYFGSSALVITLVLLGKWLERGARRRAADSVRTLAGLCPDRVVQLDRNGAERETPLVELRPGDLLVVPPGGRIAVDGVVREGGSGVDESFLTGESRLVARSRGDRVIAGSLAVDGRLVIEALSVGAQTRLAGIVRLLETAQTSRAPVQRLADRAGAVLVPVVLCVALFTFVGWWASTGDPSRALLHAVSVLVIACPCAIGLATPTALVAGIGAAARAGILIRDAAAVERARGVGIVAFDKTGTLTLGRPALERVIPAGGGGHYAEAAELLSLAAAMQPGSEHPLAEAVRTSSSHAVTQVAERFAVLPGRGVSARVGGRSLLLGNRRIIESEGLELSGTLAGEAERIEAEGGTVSFLAERRPGKAGGNRILGVLGFSDAIRPGAADAVARFGRRGIMTVMLTGDGEGAARRVAEAVGIDRMLSGMMPEEKAAAVRALAHELRGGPAPRVAMVGEGVNDIPALAASDLGIVMGVSGSGGTDAAIEAACITLLHSDPGLVADAIEIAALTAARIRQNLFWALVFNLACIPAAAAGLLNPALAAAAMVLGSVSVVANALRLKSWRPESDEPRESAAATA